MMRHISVTARLEPYIVKRLRRAWAAIERYRAAQRDYRHLSQLGERELKDIGLTREDVDHLLSEPFDWKDL